MQDQKQSLLEFKALALSVAKDLFEFAKNPVQGMKNLPEWNLSVAIITQLSIAALSGIISGILLGKLSKILNGFIALPISTLFFTTLISMSFFYLFKFFYKREIPFKKIFLIIIWASWPWLIFSPLMDIVEPLRILGLCASGLLLIIGMHEHTQLGKYQLSRLVFGAIIIYTLFWLIQIFQMNETKRDYRRMATPESLDILEKEFK